MKKTIITLIVLIFSMDLVWAARVNLYNKHTLSDWLVYVDADLAKLKPDVEEKGLPILKKSLDSLAKKFPKPFFDDARSRGLKIFITSSRKIGNRNGMFFVPKNNSDWSRELERIMDNSIIIEYKTIFMKTSDFSYYLIHEFAHYYHFSILGSENEHVQRKYYFVKNDPSFKGSYALSSHTEFFAELSAMYFMMPEDLAKLDKDSLSLMRHLWSPKVLKSKIAALDRSIESWVDWDAVRRRNEAARKKLFNR